MGDTPKSPMTEMTTVGWARAYEPVRVWQLAPGEVTRTFLARPPCGVPLPAGHLPLTCRLYPELDDLETGAVRATEAAALLNGGPHGADSYWHWMLDYLPRLWVYERAGVPAEVPLVVNADLTDVQAETLAVYAPGCGLLAKTTAERLRVPELWVASFLGATGVVAPEAVAFLRRAERPGGGPKRVYLTRRGIAARALPGEETIELMLRRRGFAVVACHALPFAGQVEALASAALIVAPHGGAMANLAFAPPGATFVEIATKPFHTGGPSMAAACGLRYRRVDHGAGLAADLAYAVDREIGG